MSNKQEPSADLKYQYTGKSQPPKDGARDANQRIYYPYLPSEDLIEAVNLAIALERPLLLEGEPGCGKTRLAGAVVYEFTQKYLQEQPNQSGKQKWWDYYIWNIKSIIRARDGLYTYDAVARLRDAQLMGTNPQQLRAELLLLIDDSPAMIPFFPALQPFLQAIADARITPARIYRFTSYPDEYLYDWYRPSQAEPLTELLPKLHRNRTIALILSDAGAATATYSQERIEGISNFLTALSPCVRQLIWLNPLPPPRWEQTSAWTINDVLNGKMLTYEPASLRTATREIPQESMIKTWRIYPHL